MPFQGWAAFKGLISKDEGPWFRTPKTGHVTDQVRHLHRLYLLRRWITRNQDARKTPPPPRPAVPPVATTGLRIRPRWLGWIVAGGLILAFGGLALIGSRAPMVDAAANPLYLHGSGSAPACTPSTMDQNVGTRATACKVVTASPAITTVWSFSNLPAQTVSAGVWSFEMYWSGGSLTTLDSVTVAVGTAAGSSCAGFTATIPNSGTTWTTTYGAGGINTTSPITVSTSGSQAALSIPAGGSLCLQVTLLHLSVGGTTSLTYDGTAGVADTQLIPPSIVVPESLLPYAGLALAIPLITWRRRLVPLMRAPR